jgi:[NiFe] hydrogenase assembly HybE family chaperone
MTDHAAVATIEADGLAARLQAAFERVQQERMTGLPFLNAALRVELVGLRRWRGLWLGVLVTPWFMNLMLLPGGHSDDDGDEVPVSWPRIATGEYAQFAFPAGVMSFLAGSEGEVGGYLACSLFSPVFEFADQAAARQMAQACLLALFDPASGTGGPAPAADAATASPAISKRDFLRGRWHAPAPPPTERR